MIDKQSPQTRLASSNWSSRLRLTLPREQAGHGRRQARSQLARDLGRGEFAEVAKKNFLRLTPWWGANCVSHH